jgi:hypothetical protein
LSCPIESNVDCLCDRAIIAHDGIKEFPENATYCGARVWDRQTLALPTSRARYRSISGNLSAGYAELPLQSAVRHELTGADLPSILNESLGIPFNKIVWYIDKGVCRPHTSNCLRRAARQGGRVVGRMQPEVPIGALDSAIKRQMALGGIVHDECYDSGVDGVLVSIA